MVGGNLKSKELSTKEYLDALNELEKMANAQGYSVLDDTNQGVEDVSAFKDGADDQKKQAAAFKKKGWGKPKTLKTGRTLPAFSKVKHKGGARGARSSRLRMLKKNNTFSAGYPKSREGSRGASSDAKKFIKKYGKKGWEKLKKEGIKRWNQLKAKAKYEKSFKDTLTYGKKKYAQVKLGYGFKTFANVDKVTLNTDAYGEVSIFNKTKTIFKADGTFKADMKKKTTAAKLTFSVLGQEHVIFNHRPGKTSGSRGARGGAVAWQAADRKAYEREFSKKIHFPLAFVNVSVEVGASFSAGVEYRAVVKKTGVVSAEVTPFVNADGFARFAVDLLIVSAGIEGQVKLLDIEVRVMGEAGLSSDDISPLFAYAFFAGDLALEALSGKISVFIKVDLLLWSKKYRHTIWNWKGIRKTWRLFNIEMARIPLMGGQATSEVVQAVKRNKVSDKRGGKEVAPVPPEDFKGSKGKSGYWGKAGPFVSCPTGSYAYAFRQKIQPKQGKGWRLPTQDQITRACRPGGNAAGQMMCRTLRLKAKGGELDDTGLNGIEVRCRTAGGQETSASGIRSTVGPKGKWSKWAQCDRGDHIKSFRVKYEKKQGSGDDTGANQIEFRCGNGKRLNPPVPGDGGFGKFKDKWGQACPKGSRMTRFRTYVEPHEAQRNALRKKQGKKPKQYDDTGMTGLGIRCEAFKKSRSKSLVCAEGSRDGAQNCQVLKVNLAKAGGKNCRRGGRCACGFVDGKKKGTLLTCIRKKGKKKLNCPGGWKTRRFKVPLLGSFVACQRGVRLNDAAKCHQPLTPLGFKMKQGCPYWLTSKYKAIYRLAKERL